jgi:hypothetical protein
MSISMDSQQPATPIFRSTQTGADSSDFCLATLSDVQVGIAEAGYSKQLIHFVKGEVEDTIPSQAPSQIAVLRLDTVGTNPLVTNLSTFSRVCLAEGF